jgi:tetratricopeptide (TPR) repeat protein
VPDAATGRYRVTDKAAHIPIPDTLHGVIMARIDRLDDDLKQVLRLASVLGRSFFYRVLASVGEAERELDQSLTDLETRELIREKARVPELEYVFKHALVQEATYESILLQRRKELHRKVALATETIFPDRLEEFFSLLAYHYSKAEDWEKAQDYLFKAGDQAGKIAADTEALAHYEEAIDAYAQAFGDKWDPLQRAVLERKMGEALYRRGDHQQAREYLYRALATLGHPFPEAPGAVRRALLAELMRQVRHRVIPRSGRRMSTLSARRLAEERCALHRVLGVIEQYADFSKAGLHSFLALNVAEDAHLDATVFLMSVYIGVICGIIGLPRLGVPYLNRALPGAERLGEPSVLGHVQWFAATYYLWIDDDWERAYELTKSACGVLSAAGDVREWASAMCMRVHPLVEWGRLAEGLDLAREVTRVGRESGDLYTEAWGVAWEGEVQYMMGSLEEGEQKMQVALAALLARSDFRIGAKVAGHLAHCLLDEGKLDEALPLLLENQARARKYGLIGGTLHYANTGLAAARLLAAEHAEPQDKGAALDEARAACKNLLKSCKVDSTGLVPAHRMQGTYEWLRGRSSNAEKCWRKSLEHADKLGARYEGALSMLEIGRRLAHREQLERAASEFETMGCQFFLAEARRLLGLPEVAEQAVVA